MTLDRRIEVLSALGKDILNKPDWLQDAVQRAYYANKWFTVKESWNALEAIATHFLSKDVLLNWTSNYEINDLVEAKTVGLVLAGNIPLVGFHDVLCCFISGHNTLAKLSAKDEVLMKTIVGRLVEFDPQVAGRIIVSERLKGFDAIIATGSNNSSTYFEQYFGKYPNIIRKNRNAIAVLNGQETEEDFIALGHDIFDYFGLGCRNVSKLYVPSGYKFDDMLGALHEHYKELANHDKYRNNFDYNNALFMLNKVEYLMSGSLIITESDAIASRIATIHYSYYDNLSLLTKELIDRKEEIQCVVGKVVIDGHHVFDFGQAQQPSILDYADGVDTMEFLTNL
ncbi:MAG: hypothetical protein ACJA1A_002537 [Saprospiraceae bacterium]|jgi:hypothetical protein